MNFFVSDMIASKTLVIAGKIEIDLELLLFIVTFV